MLRAGQTYWAVVLMAFGMPAAFHTSTAEAQCYYGFGFTYVSPRVACVPARAVCAPRVCVPSAAYCYSPVYRPVARVGYYYPRAIAATTCYRPYGYYRPYRYYRRVYYRPGYGHYRPRGRGFSFGFSYYR
jgi:hypothetical protein